MAKIKTDQLKAGMRVTERVKNKDDVVLLPAGYLLAERHISMLVACGIDAVEVEADEHPAD